MQWEIQFFNCEESNSTNKLSEGSGSSSRARNEKYRPATALILVGSDPSCTSDLQNYKINFFSIISLIVWKFYGCLIKLMQTLSWQELGQ
jgi:hypothetical protein